MNLIEQVVGRAVRNYSHKALPFEKRNVQIFLHGTLIEGFEEGKEEEAIDLYLYRTAETKAVQIGKVTRILKETAVDCIINHEQTEFTQEKFTEKIGVVEQVLSDGQKIDDYKVGDAPYSPSNDYMESGDYKCLPLLNEEEMKLVIDKPDESTYTEPYVLVNIDRIINKIKMLMKEQFFYKRNDLLTLVSIPKKYATIEIYAALSRLVEESSEIITDKYGRPGTLVNIGEYYLFQPLELKDKGLSIFERSTPVDYKHRMLRFDITDMKGVEVEHAEDEEEAEAEVEAHGQTPSKMKIELNYENTVKDCMKNFLFVIKFYKIRRTTNQRNRNIDKDTKEKFTDEQLWYKQFGEHIDDMSNILHISIVESFRYLTEHIVESLVMEDKVKLLQFVYLNKEKYKGDNISIETIEEEIKTSQISGNLKDKETINKWTDKFCKLSYEYFERTKIVPDIRGQTKKLDYQLFFTNKSSEYKLWGMDRNASKEDIHLWKPIDNIIHKQNVERTQKYKENINVSNSRYNDIIGFIGFEKNKYELSFKTKRDMKEMTEKKRGNPGAKCLDAKKETTVKMINELLGKEFIKVLYEKYKTGTGVEKEKEVTYILKDEAEDEYDKDETYNKITCCILLETILRHKQSLNNDTNDKIWFLTPENALLQNLYKIVEK